MISFDLRKRLRSAAGEMPLEVALEVADGECLALYGPSGAGKSSLLRMLAGLMQPDGGHISGAGHVWYDAARKIWLPPQRRGLGFVFQDYGLFPHMTVRQNLAFALHPDKNESLVAELLAVTGLEALRDQKPAALSGGQQQRAALARALVQQPRILLLDEPLSALDAATRSKLQDYLADVQRSWGMTTILVSHDAAEIQRLASRVVELREGRILRQADAADFFRLPSPAGGPILHAEVEAVREEGGKYILTLKLAGQSVELEVDAEEGKKAQESGQIHLMIKGLTEAK